MTFRNVSTEIEENVEVDNERLTHKIIKQYNKAYKEYESKSPGESLGSWLSNYHEFNVKLFNIASSNIASPGQIWVTASELVSKYNDSAKRHKSSIGELISNLIIESYKAGHNNFKIKTDDFPAIKYFQNDLKTPIKRPLTIDIKGNVSAMCFSEYHPNYINVTINGSLENWISRSVINSTVTINGKIEDRRSNYGSMYNCLFRTQDEEIYQTLLEKRGGKKNKVQLIDEKGSIIKSKKIVRSLERDYNNLRKKHRKNVRREFFSKIKSKLIK